MVIKTSTDRLPHHRHSGGGRCAAGTNAHVIMEAGDAVGSLVATGVSLQWQRLRHWVAPAPSAWLSRALPSGWSAAAGSIAQLECDLQSPRLAFVRDWRIAGRAALPFGVCTAAAATAAAVLLGGGSAKSPARFALIGCALPAQVLPQPSGGKLQVNAALCGKVQLLLLSPESDRTGSVFNCAAVRLRRSASATLLHRARGSALGAMEGVVACHIPPLTGAVRAVSRTVSRKQQEPSLGSAVSLSAAFSAAGLTALSSDALTAAAAACMVTEQDEQDVSGGSAAVASWGASTTVLASQDTVGLLAVCADVTTVPLCQAIQRQEQEQCGVQQSRLLYHVQWQADSTTSQSTSPGGPNTACTPSALLAAPRWRCMTADPLPVTTRMLAVMQTSAALGTVCCHVSPGEESTCPAGSQSAARGGAAQSALRGLLRTAAAEDPNSVSLNTLCRRSDAHGYIATVELLPRRSADRKHHGTRPLGCPVQRGSVIHRPLLLPAARSITQTHKLLAEPAATLVSADVSRMRTALITGGLGGLGKQVAAWLLTLGAARIVLASRSGRCGARAMQSMYCGGGAATIVRCDVASQADAAWLAADAPSGPVDVRPRTSPSLNLVGLCHTRMQGR